MIEKKKEAFLASSLPKCSRRSSRLQKNAVGKVDLVDYANSSEELEVSSEETEIVMPPPQENPEDPAQQEALQVATSNPGGSLF